MERPCNYCDDHQLVNLDKDSNGKWIATNLDGSFHKHNRFGGSSSQGQQNQPTVIDRLTEAKESNPRSEAIAKAHDENMEASAKLSQTIQALVDKLTDLEKLLSRYLEGQA